MRFKKEYSPDFKSQARTLPPEAVFGPTHDGEVGEYSFTHESGWTIRGSICEDWFYWVNAFEATHPTLGWVRGDFETLVEAKSMKAFEHFIANHPPEEWDYWDI